MTENPFVNAGYNPDVRPSAEERADTPRDQYGRYMLPRPGMEGTAAAPVPCTRVSTIKSVGIDRKGLEIYGKRTQTKGFLRDIDPNGPILQVPGAELLIAALKVLEADPDAKGALDDIGEEAYNRGGGKERSRLGTAVHAFTEDMNAGRARSIEDAPAEHRRDIQAYLEALAANGVQAIPEYLERIVNCPWSIQGTVDNIVWFQNPRIQPEGIVNGTNAPGELEMRVADLKTGRDLSLGWGEILIQLWLYANAREMWDALTKTWVPMPTDLRKDRALIFHVPMDGTAHVYDVDLGGVGEVVAAAMTLRRFHNEAALKATKLGSVDRREPAFVVPSASAPAYGTPEPTKFVKEPLSPGSGSYRVTEAPISDPRPTPAELKGFTPDQFRPDTSTEPQGEALAALQAQVDSAAAQLAEQPGTIRPDGSMTVDPADVEAAPLPGLKAKDGTPLQPLAKSIPGKRGCGKCGRIGHKRNSPACWGDDDPALRGQKTDATGQMPDAAPNAQVTPDVTGNPTGVGQSHNPGTCPGGGWTNRGDGVFVCATCRLPSEAVATTVNQAVATGALPPAPKLSDPPATVPQDAPQWPSDWVLEDMNRAQSASAVLSIRELAISRGSWNPELHDAPGKARYEALTKEGKL